MGILDNIIYLLKTSGKKQKELSDYLGISKNALTEWKAGRNSSYIRYLPQIAEFFEVSLDMLTGQKNAPPVTTDEANTLFDLYEKADPKTRAAVELLLGFHKEG